jgi:hypothetical protein
MKTLTIKNPWALLIAAGIKDIENRTWRTKFRGRIYIHAGQSLACKSFGDLGSLMTAEQIRGMGLDYLGVRDVLLKSAFNKSMIIGEVDIIDCVINHPSIWAEQMAYAVCQETGIHILRKGQQYVWNWVLANPVLYGNPIENVKGKLSFWEYERV